MKTKKEFQAENSLLKEELTKIKAAFSELNGKYENLQKQNSLEMTKNQVFECEQCDDTFESLPDLKKHQHTHKAFKRTYKCDDCGRSFEEEWKMQAHRKKHKKFDCDKCGKLFQFTDTLEKHEKIVHGNAKLTRKQELNNMNLTQLFQTELKLGIKIKC